MLFIFVEINGFKQEGGGEFFIKRFSQILNKNEPLSNNHRLSNQGRQ